MRITKAVAWSPFLRFLSVLGLTMATSAGAADKAADLVRQAAANPELRQTLIAEGSKAAFFCANCHGDVGISRYTNVPNLAGQHPAYTLTQIGLFLSGERKDDFMQGLMKVLNEREKAAIALMYDSLTVPPATQPGPLAGTGAKLYQQHCARCHQDDAHGSETFPRLAGQQPDYLKISLRRYLTQSGERFYAPMTGAVMQLGGRNIDAVVDYLSSLR
jgi:cytochrome c553